MAVLAIFLTTQSLIAAPARPQAKTITQPDGTQITILLHGDEWHHWVTDLNGHQLTLNTDGFYRFSTEEQLAESLHNQVKGDSLRASANAKRVLRSASARASAKGSGDATPDNHFDFPTKGRIHGIVVLVEYQDVRFSVSADSIHSHYQDMMMKDGFDYAINEKYRHYGSAHDYFCDNSMGLFEPIYDVYGPLLLQHERKYYGENNDSKASAMIVEACEQLENSGIDFSQYDNNNDGQVDFIFAYYAGAGENESGVSSDAVWPHSWDVRSAGYNISYDGVEIGDYSCTCELFGGQLDGLGQFCHEFSHVLGLPDEYCTNMSGDITTPRELSIMDIGCFLLNGYWPCGYSAYQRYELGWLQPSVLESEIAVKKSLTDFGTTNQAYIVRVETENEDPRDGEYYLFENRQNTAWDRCLPAHGMYVWHIDYNDFTWRENVPNNYKDHHMIELVRADAAIKNQSPSTSFPGASNITEFTDDTDPSFRGWDNPGTSDSGLNVRLGKPITNIRENDGLIEFDFMGTPEVLQTIHPDARVSGHICIIEGHPTIITADGNHYSLQGQRK